MLSVNEALERLDELSLPEIYFNEAYQASCWNDVAFIPATNEQQYQVNNQQCIRKMVIRLTLLFTSLNLN